MAWILAAGCSGELLRPQTDPAGPSAVPRPGPDGREARDAPDIPEDGRPEPGTPPAADACRQAEIPADRPRRLNITELNTIASDVMDIHNDPFNVLGTDYMERVGTQLGTSERFVADYVDVTVELARQFVDENPAWRDCGGATCARTLLENLSEILLRHPVDSSTVDRWIELVDEAVALGLEPADGLASAVASIWISPDFLLIGTDVAATPGELRLSDFEIAERLALAIWNSVPDATLLRAAADGALRTRDGVASRVERMLADPDRGTRWIETFIDSHFDLPSGAAVPLGLEGERNASRLADDMRTEAVLLIRHVFEQDLPVSTLVRSETSFLNERLARHYGVEGVEGNEFRQVSLAGTERTGGLLTTGAVLAQEVDLIHRGVNALQTYSCQPLLAPDPEVIEAASDDIPGDASVREHVEYRMESDACKSCHLLIDPLGAAFETFDAAGRFRSEYPDGEPIDYRIEALGQWIEGPSDVGDVLVEGDLAACLTAQVLGFSSFRRLMLHRRNDRCAAQSMLAELGPDPGLRSLMVHAFTTDTFSHRVVE